MSHTKYMTLRMYIHCILLLTLPPPSLPDMDIEEDAADREARLKAQAAAREEEARRRRSQVLQRGLPRPLALDGLPQPTQQSGLRAQAEQLVLQELRALLAHDAAKYPVHGRKRGREEGGDLEHEFSMELLQQARDDCVVVLRDTLG